MMMTMVMFTLPLQMTSPCSGPFSFLTWIFVSTLSNCCFHACLLSINPMYQSRDASDSSSASYPIRPFFTWAAPVSLEWIIRSAPSGLPDTIQRLSSQVNASLKPFSAYQLSWYLTILINIDLVYVSCVCIVHFHCMFFFDFSSSPVGVYTWGYELSPKFMSLYTLAA